MYILFSELDMNNSNNILPLDNDLTKSQQNTTDVNMKSVNADDANDDNNDKLSTLSSTNHHHHDDDDNNNNNTQQKQASFDNHGYIIPTPANRQLDNNAKVQEYLQSLPKIATETSSVSRPDSPISEESSTTSPPPPPLPTRYVASAPPLNLVGGPTKLYPELDHFDEPLTVEEPTYELIDNDRKVILDDPSNPNTSNLDVVSGVFNALKSKLLALPATPPPPPESSSNNPDDETDDTLDQESSNKSSSNKKRKSRNAKSRSKK